MKILFAGGGTGGHIFPIIAILREIKKIYPKPDLEIFFIGPVDKFYSKLLLKEGIKPKFILAGKIRRYFNIISFFQNLIDILIKFPIGFIQSFWYIFFLSPDLIFSKGGYGSLPGVISGKILQVPVFLHESDITPGLANRLISRWALEVFVSFSVKATEYFPKEKMISVGNPIRKEILKGSREKAGEMFKLSGEKPVILILGGSQGAKRINDILIPILPKILADFEIIHQAGFRNFKLIERQSKAILSKELLKYYHLFPFLDEKKYTQALAAADLIVSRAGSGSIFEISALGKPSILIPLPEAAQGHQLKNALAFAENESAIVIEEANLSSHYFLGQLKYLFDYPQRLEEMGKRAKEFSRPQAARIIANYLVEYLTK